MAAPAVQPNEGPSNLPRLRLVPETKALCTPATLPRSPPQHPVKPWLLLAAESPVILLPSA